ncbi:MAG: AAA family ATPase, partial [Ktedonobacteraceae bacterium]|nr:AAA family ATPase [Ktedonobacteraceae bacterium]
MIPPLHIHLLGDFLLVSGDIPVTTITVPRLQSLLAYLLLHRDTPQNRSHLAFLLWPDSTEAQAHTNLRKLLYQLRQAFPDIDQFLYTDKQSLQWRPAQSDVSWTLDLMELEQALARAKQAEQAQDSGTMREALEQVMHLYRGDLLPSCYEEWILPERDRWRQLFLSAAERLLVLLEQERNYDAAILVAQQLLRHDPLHEATYRQLMRLYALRGDRAAALRIYHTCVTALERELGTEPGEATQAIYESLMQSDATSRTLTGPLISRGTAPPLLGRKTEWRQLLDAWRKAAKGQPHVVVLSGEAGIGKTRLAEEMEAWVGRQGMTTASARCYAALGPLAYAPVTTWLRSDALQASISTLDPTWLTEVARLVPEALTSRLHLSRPAAMTEGWQRRHFFEALARAILSAHQPLLLLLDDLQWCDQETLEWLHYLLRFDAKARLLLLGTVRIEEVLPGHPLREFLGALQRDGLVTEIAPGPLTMTETTSLAEHIQGQSLDLAMSLALHSETEGNPLFVVEMVRAGTLEQHEARQNATDSFPLLTDTASTLPPSVQTVLAARLAQLSPLARNVANVAAVIGREFPFSILARASGQSEDDVVQGLDELWQRRMVREQAAGTGDTYDFSHDKLREVAYTSLSPVRQRLLHRRIAEAFETGYAQDLDAVSGQIATHYERAGQPERAVPYYRR